MPMHHAAISALSSCYNIFPRYLINGTVFEKKNLLSKSVRFGFIYRNFCLKYFSFWEELSEIRLKVYNGLGVKYRLFFSNVNKTWIFSTDFRKIFK